MLSLGRCTADNGIQIASRRGGHVSDAQASQHIANGIRTALSKRHVVLFRTTLIAVTYDSGGSDIAAFLDAIGILLNHRSGVAADGRLIKVEVGQAHLADRRIHAASVLANLGCRAILVSQALRRLHAAIVLADLTLFAILGHSLGIALRTATAITAFLTCRAMNASFGIAVTINSLAFAVIANVAFVSLA